MTSIGNYQYTGLGTINKIYLHPNITSIGEYAFSGLKYNGVEIHFSGSENQWNSFAYKDLFTDSFELNCALIRGSLKIIKLSS
jgi:hypothetical protein